MESDVCVGGVSSAAGIAGNGFDDGCATFCTNDPLNNCDVFGTTGVVGAAGVVGVVGVICSFIQKPLTSGHEYGSGPEYSPLKIDGKCVVSLVLLV